MLPELGQCAVITELSSSRMSAQKRLYLRTGTPDDNSGQANPDLVSRGVGLTELIS